MGFIGVQPASVPLTASDITNDIINADKIADDSISEEHIDNTAITGFSALTSLADTDKFLVSDASDSGNLKYVEKQYLGGGAFVQTGRVNNSSVGASSINLEGCFSNTYDVYMLIIKDFRPSTDGSYGRMRILKSTNTVVTASEYRVANSVEHSGGTKTERHTSSDEFHLFDEVCSVESEGGACATIFITLDKTNNSGCAWKHHGTCQYVDSNSSGKRPHTGKLGGFYYDTTGTHNPTGILIRSNNNITSIDMTVYGLVQS